MTENPTRPLDNDPFRPRDQDTRRIDLPEDEAAQPRPCLRCGRQMIEARLSGFTQSSYGLRIEVLVPPTFAERLLWDAKTPASSVQTLVCTACGYIEFYAPQAEDLLSGDSGEE